MAAIRFRGSLLGALLTVAGVLLTHPARAQAPAAADSGALFDDAATKARDAASRLETPAGRAARPDPAQQQYLAALQLINRKQYDSALAPLHAAAVVNRNSARYHGDLGYALAETGRFDDAATEFQTAIRLQSANPWYYVELGLIRLNQERWTESSANFELAYATDSTIVSPLLVAAASRAAEKAADENALFQWSQRGTARFPDDPLPWLRLATLLRSRGDTVKGLDAIRHFRSLDRQDRLGAAVYALYLYDRAQYDSAVIMARQAVADSSLHQYASAVFLRAGAHWVNAKQYDSAATVLEEGRAITPPGLNRMRYTFYLGLADLMRIPTIYSAAVQAKDCSRATLLDSLLASVQSNITEAAQLDSAQSARILTSYVPSLRQRLDDFKESCH